MSGGLTSPLLTQIQPFKSEPLLELLAKKTKEFEDELISKVLTFTEADVITSIITKSDGSVVYSLKGGSIMHLNPITLQSKELFKLEGMFKLTQSNDESYICAFGSTNSAFVFSMDSIKEYIGHEKPIRNASFSPNSKLLITASVDNTAIVWQLQTHTILARLQGHTKQVNTARIDSSNSLALTCSHDTEVILWKIPTLDDPEVKIMAQFKGHTSTVNDCIFSLDESVALSTASDNTVRIWSIAALSLSGTLRGHSDNVNQVFNISNELIASLGDLTIRIWNIQTKLAEAVLYGHTSSPEKLVITSKYLFTTSPDLTIRVWDKQTYAQVAVYKGHTGEVFGLMASKDGNTLYSGGNDKLIKIWNIDESYLVGTLNYHPDFVVGVAITKDNKWIISGGGGGVIAKWDTTSMTKEGEFRGHTASVFRLAFVQNDTAFLSVSGDKSLKMWNFQTGEILFSKVGHGGVVYFLGIAADESFILTGGFDSKIVCWNFDPKEDAGRTLAYLTEYPAPIGNKKERGMILSFAISKDCKTMISVGRDRCVRFWDTQTLAETKAIDRKDFYEIAVAISSDDSKFATGSQDCIIRLWSMKELCIIGIFEGHLEKIDVLVFLNSDSHLISGSSDTSIRIWNLGEMSFEAALEGHTDRVRNLCLSNDQSLIVSVSTDHSVKVWKYFVAEPEPGKINFQGVKDQWKGLFALTYMKAKPETWMKYIYIQPYRINRLHIYCHTNNHKDLATALSKGFQLITSSEGEHPLSIAIKENSANCVDQILSYLCGLATSSPFVFENTVMKVSPIFPMLLNYSPSNIKMFLDTLMIETTEDLPNLGIPVDTLPKIVFTSQYSIDPNVFVKTDSTEAGKVPIQFFRSPFVWNLEIGSTSSVELLESINNCKMLQIHETKFIQNLITVKWNQIWNFIFVQTLLYWASLVFFALTLFSVCDRFYYALILLILNLVLGTYELADMLSKIPYYFKSLLNWIDLVVFSGTIVWCFMIVVADIDPIGKDYVYFSWILAAGNSLRGLTYFRTFEPTRFYIRMIFQAIIDSYAFILILVYSSLCFGIIDYLSLPEHNETGLEALGVILIKSYSMNLSDFNQPETILSSLTFVIQSCVNIIVIFNLLISILGSSYSSFENVSAMYNYKEMLEVIIEVERIMMWKRDFGTNSNIQCCEVSVAFESRDDIFANIKNYTDEKMKQQEDTERERYEKIMTEFMRLRTDIGNVYANQMKSNA